MRLDDIDAEQRVVRDRQNVQVIRIVANGASRDVAPIALQSEGIPIKLGKNPEGFLR
jgi:hypothetical protein